MGDECSPKQFPTGSSEGRDSTHRTTKHMLLNPSSVTPRTNVSPVCCIQDTVVFLPIRIDSYTALMLYLQSPACPHGSKASPNSNLLGYESSLDSDYIIHNLGNGSKAQTYSVRVLALVGVALDHPNRQHDQYGAAIRGEEQ